MLTGDLNIADVEWIVQYRIKEPRDFLFSIRNPKETLRDVSESTMRLVVGDYSITDVLTEQRKPIETAVQRKIQTILDDYESGIEVTTVKLQDVKQPKEVKAAFESVNEARLQKETTINAAQQEWFDKIPRARGEARRMVAQAEGYRAKRVNEAEGDVARFKALFREYQRAPGVTRSRLYLEALADVLPQVNQIYIIDDSHGGPLQVLDLKQAAAVKRAGTAGKSPPRSRSGKRTSGRTQR